MPTARPKASSHLLPCQQGDGLGERQHDRHGALRSGERVVSGGYVMSPPSADAANSPNFRNYAVGAGKWSVMSAFDTPPGNLVAFAYCQRGVVVKVRSASSASIPDDGNGSATASCHKGETLLSGGYTTTPKPDFEEHDRPGLFLLRLVSVGRASWTASAHNYSNIAGKITAFAYCMP